MDQRESGILLPVSALPGPYGVGTLGAPALTFVDFLARAGRGIGRSFPWCLPGAEIPPICHPPLLRATPICWIWMSSRRRGCLPPESARRPGAPALTG